MIRDFGRSDFEYPAPIPAPDPTIKHAQDQLIFTTRRNLSAVLAQHSRAIGVTHEQLMGFSADEHLAMIFSELSRLTSMASIAESAAELLEDFN